MKIKSLIFRTAQLLLVDKVFDFLVAYQRYLLSRGFVFDGTTGVGEKNDFVTAGAEFAFWTEQKWTEGSVIVLSPYYDTLLLTEHLLQ